MQNAIVPLFSTKSFETTIDFYQKHLGFLIDVEMPGYAEIRQGEHGPRLGFMEPEEDKWPARTGEGLVYCFQVEDADAEHTRLAQEGVPILMEPEDKPWGERGFMASDPNGITLYFGHILPTAVDASVAAQ